MKISNLFFHIHYCNSRKFNERGNQKNKIARTIHHHELILVTGGKGIIINRGKRYPIKEGMLFYISPEVYHSIDSDPEEPIYFFSVHFSFVRVGMQNGKWMIENEGEMLTLNAGQELKDYYRIKNLFHKLVDSWDAKQAGYEFIAKTRLQQLLIAIYQNGKKQNQNSTTSLKMDKVIQYMHQNISRRVTLNELAELVQLSSTYLSRTFKVTTGYSVIEYFNKIKIDKAKELISEGDKKIKEVAEILGFTDEFYFSRVFKRIEGISPIEFYGKNVHGV
ncbi:AraC family transcriptional regulator [Acetobacterium tundrae]|uniref:AraC family transcriptional regulator n=1 Tax=Acetobacterium tundrae TaxID=132932 RepID=A0ABR6WK54_9FIRM|nr:AraC family transcriptional regulator [Acetobacterium tundrae]MBC3796889.1 AraC family transcriptional regulator [Acetobacterium tundrae]